MGQAKCENGAVFTSEKCKFSNSVIRLVVITYTYMTYNSTVSQTTVLLFSCDAPHRLEDSRTNDSYESVLVMNHLILMNASVNESVSAVALIVIGVAPYKQTYYTASRFS